MTTDDCNAAPNPVVTATAPAVPARFISKTEVLARVCVSYQTIWQWMREGKFPRSRELGGKAVWIESEIDAYIINSPRRRLKGDL
jgi:prophage regulatory protein